MKVISVTARTISIELDSDSAYFKGNEYKIFINEKFHSQDNRNVFTLYDLEPNTEYKITVDKTEITVRTKTETLCVPFSRFNPAKDGLTNDTLKLQAAIMACPDGGTVYVEKGDYLITSIFLKSNIMLYLEKGARLLGDVVRENFPVLPGIIRNEDTGYEANYGSWEGATVDEFATIITGLNVQNIVIAGEGEINCQAELGDWYVNHHEIRIACRPYGMYFNRCSNVEVIGIYIHNTPAWNVHPYYSNDLKFINMRIENPVAMPTTDGLDPDCCDNVLICGVYFNVGDDCIAIKSGTIDFARKYKKPCSNIVVRNCFMNAGHGGVVFGSESSGGIENVLVTQCYFKNTDRGLRIKTRRGRGRIGIIDKVKFTNIVMDGVATPFVVNMFYNMGPAGGHEEYVWTKEKLPVDERTPYIGSFEFSNMRCENVSLAAAVFLGLPEEPIKEITFRNVSFTYNSNAQPDYPVMIEHKEKMCRKGIYCENVLKLNLDNVSFDGQDGPEVIREC